MATTAQTIQSYYQTILARTGSASEVAFWVNQVDTVGIPLAQVQTDFATSPEALANVAPILQMYQADLGRAADSAGLTAWVGLEEGGTSLATIAADIAGSAESQTHNGFTAGAAPTTAFVTNLYKSILGRQPETAAVVASWVGSGLSDAQIVAAIGGSAEAIADDKAAVTTYLATGGGGSAVGETLALTPGVDAGPAFTGGPNATFIGTVTPGTNSTLNAGDSLTGVGAGNTLQIIQTISSPANDLAGVTLAGIQTVSLQSTTGGMADIDLTLSPSVSKVIALNTAGLGTDTFTGLAAGAQVVASGAATGAGAGGPFPTAVNFAYTSLTGAVSVGVDSGANGVTFNDLAGSAPTAATISSTGAANGTVANFDTFNLATGATLTSLTVNAATNLVAQLNLGNYAATAALTVSGAGSVNLTPSGTTTFKTISDSGSGALTVTADATKLTSFTGGAGNDTLTLFGALGAGSTINLGAGNNKLLGVTAVTTSSGTTINGGGTTGADSVSSGLIDAGNAGQFTNFQDLSLDNPAVTAFDVSLVAGITTLSVDTMSLGVGNYTNVTTSQGLTDTFVGDNSAATNNLSFKGLTGTSNAYTIAFNGAAQTTAPTVPNVELGEINATGINNFTIASNGGANTWNSLTLADAAANTVTITGSQNLNVAFAGFGGVPPNTGVTSISGSAATGKLTIDTTGVVAAAGATNALVNGLTITGGSGNDTLIAITNATLTGGAGADTFNAMNFVNNATGLADVTDFTAGTDKLAVVAGTADTFASTAQNIGLATNLGTALSAATVAGQITWFQLGGNTFVDQAGTGSATGTFNAAAGAAGAHVIELAGQIDLSHLGLTGNTLA